MGKIELASGVLLIIVGLLVATGTLQTLSQNLSGEFADFSYSLEESVIGSLTGGIQDSPAPADDGAQSGESGTALNTITGAASAVPTIGTDIGSLAPDFTTMREDGQPIKLSDLRGQVVLLNFWATWCGPCRIEMPEFQAAYAEYAGQGFTVLAVNNMETADQIQDFRDAMKLTFPMALDERGSIANLYNLKGFPGTYIIDRSGIIVARFLGVMTKEQIEQAVGAALSA
jgi:peroxiredoxin